MVEIYHTGTCVRIKAKKCSPILLFASSVLPLFTRNTVYHMSIYHNDIAQFWQQKTGTIGSLQVTTNPAKSHPLTMFTLADLLCKAANPQTITI